LNSAINGSAIRFAVGSSSPFGSIFVSNSDLFYKNKALEFGGAIYIYSQNSQVITTTILGSNFTNNYAFASGGAIYFAG
jgi:hypothetical protein